MDDWSGCDIRCPSFWKALILLYSKFPYIVPKRFWPLLLLPESPAKICVLLKKLALCFGEFGS